MAVSIDCAVREPVELGESPVWSVAEQKLYWVDIAAGRLHRFDPATTRDEQWQLPQQAGNVVMRGSGGVLLALERGLYGFDPATGRLEQLYDPEPDQLDNRCNDGTTDPKGRLIIGTMRKQELGMRRQGTLYRFDADHSCHVIERDIWTPNGLAFSPDGKTMYFSDSYFEVRTIWRYDYDADAGVASNKRVFVDTHGMPGRPDGGAVDADGCYWMAGVGGWQLVRFTPQGKIDRIIEMTVERPSKVAFGGPQLDVMYVTSIRAGLTPGSEARQPLAGCLLVIHAGIKGLPVPAFAG